MARAQRRAICFCAALGALALASCGEEDERRPVASSQAPSSQESTQQAPTQAMSPSGASIASPRGAGAGREWLDVGDATAPEVFLATRSTPKGAPPASPEAVAEIAALLGEADVVFDENRRMLANRTLQLERMLGEISVVETPQALLAGFIAVGRAVGRIGYSDLCQHYFNLRAAGARRAEALAVLATPAAERRKP
ncbi:hypothetical protein [Xanthobacter flavus]|uniref:hypothetical protein n=1 Tax=Xanthobacter flavus TaxID=281 RepID=UPI001AE5A507|nr:hypothetical protein [Xanthobacter flavus]MBP2148070.1 hypothetical protein [Xanthobacter flavus]